MRILLPHNVTEAACLTPEECDALALIRSDDKGDIDGDDSDDGPYIDLFCPSEDSSDWESVDYDHERMKIHLFTTFLKINAIVKIHPPSPAVDQEK